MDAPEVKRHCVQICTKIGATGLSLVDVLRWVSRCGLRSIGE
jgi:hypothetical protein